ncbi:MAG: A/G-specific adenine glycosylase [Myxococcota bacterium]
MRDVRPIREHLAAWYHTRRRRLPWREDPTPYRVWISEIMLQQTRVDTVIPYFERFVSAFPDAQALADAGEEDVLGLWAGLGYYRRARHLHAAAGEVVERFDGRLPDTVEALKSLPGIGRYTAGAIASIAFGRAEAVLDGNVARVLSRLTAFGDPVNTAAGERFLWETAEALVDTDDPSSHNQAMMEIGALVCTPKQPACPECPLRAFCRAAAEGTPERFPVKKGRRRPREALAVSGLVRDAQGRVLLARRPPDVLLGGLWELPGGDLPLRAAREEGLRDHLGERLGLDARVGRHLASVEHVFTHRRLTLEIYHVDRHAGRPEPSWYTDWRWLEGGALRSVPLSRLTEKVLDALGYTDG